MKFVFIGKMRDVLEVLSVLAEIEREFPHIAAQFDGEVINLLHNGDI